MELKDVLDERIIDLNMEAKNKDEAIRHLAAKLKDANYIGDVEEFVKDIYLRESEGVTGIAGSAGRGLKPTPVSKSEMEPVLKRMNMIDSSMYEGYNPGDRVKILHGALEGSEAVIESINKETGVCHIKTFFFGRETPMDVEISEIEKI